MRFPLAAVAALLLAAAQATAADGASPAELAAQVETGRKSYTSLCARCHGIRLVSGGIGMDLRTFPSDDKARFERAVAKGVRAMPAWEGVLKPGEMDALWAYVGSVNGWGEAKQAKP